MIDRTFTLTPEIDRFIDKLVETGRYRSASEVVCEALRHLADEGRTEQRSRDKTGEAVVEEQGQESVPHNAGSATFEENVAMTRMILEDAARIREEGDRTMASVSEWLSRQLERR